MYNSSQIKEQISKLNQEQKWNHNITLPGGIETRPIKQISHGKNLIKWKRIEPIIDLISMENKTVLDLGCNEGFFSIKLAEKKAIVLGIDIDKLRIKKANFIQSVLGFDNPKFEVLDIYSNQFKKLFKAWSNDFPPIFLLLFIIYFMKNIN